MKNYPLLYILLLISIFTFGQQAPKVKKTLGTGVLVSTAGTTPFWIRSNTYGTIPIKSQGAYVFGGIEKLYDSTFNFKKKLRKTDYAYGLGVHANLNSASNIVLPEAFLKLRWRAFELAGGRFKEENYLADYELGSGHFIWSGNAAPIPKIQIGFPNYVSIIGKGLISIKGLFAHGWFGKQPYTTGHYLHQKNLYGKIGRNNSLLQFEAGINNQIQWGGYSELLKYSKYSSSNGYLPSDFNYYLGTSFPIPWVRRTFPSKTKLEYDDANYGGNVLGSVDFGINLNLKSFNFKFYKNIPYETGSTFTSIVNFDDGLYGFSFETKSTQIINKILIEGIHTYNQGSYRAGIARLFNIKDSHFGEVHGYLNHGQYLEGWSNKKRNLGSPYIIPNFEGKEDLKKLVTMSSFNQVKGLTLGLKGNFLKNTYTLKVSQANYKPTSFHGSQVKSIPQFYLFSELSRNINNNTNIKFQASFDNQGFLQRNFGLHATYQRLWY